MRYSRSPILSMPVTLDEAKQHMRVDHDHEDWLIQRYILAAAHEIEAHCEIALTRQTISLTGETDGEPINMPVGPLAPDAAITVNGTETTEGIEGGRYPRLTLRPEVTGTVAITYEAGHGDTSDSVPDDLQLAILEQVAWSYDHRGDADAEPGLTPAAARICARHRRVAL